MSKFKLTYDDFKKYFGNNLQNKDKHDFEKKMMQDAFEEEAFDGLSKLSEDELENDIEELKSDILTFGKRKKRIIPVWSRYAAGVIILMGVAFTLFFTSDRFWKDSLLKEQVAKEMQVADSIVTDAEKNMADFEEAEINDSLLKEEMIAENKSFKKEETESAPPVPQKKEAKNTIIYDENEKVEIIETKIVSDDLVLENEDLAFEEEVVDAEYLAPGIVSKQENKQASIAEKKATRKVIKGKVVDSQNQSIPEVTIVSEENPSIGTTTNIDGEFELQLPEDEELKTLIASFVGMKPESISVGGQTQLLVLLEEDDMSLDEVVVTSYGKRRSRKIETVKLENNPAQPPAPLTTESFKKHITENLNYSVLADFKGKHKIVFTFIVNADGSLSDFVFVRSPDVIFNTEIEKTVKQAGNWIPAKKDGIENKSEVKLSIKVSVK